MPARSLGLAALPLALAIAPVSLVARPLQDDPPAEEILLGKPSSIRPVEQPLDTVLVTTGTNVYRLPDRRSALVDVLDFDAQRPVLERAEGWVRIRVQAEAGWVAIADGRAGPDVETPPDLTILASRRQPLTPLPERLERARAIVGDEGRSIGPFTLYTDVTDPETIDRIVTLATETPGAYTQHYGLEPRASDRFAVVVFAKEASYRVFENHESELVGLEAGGHSGGSVAAVYIEKRREDELGSTLLHELTHLLNRSAFYAALPTWLEEGMAEDLSYSHIGPAGQIDPTRLGGADRGRLQFDRNGMLTYVTESWGAPTALARLIEAQRRGELTGLRDLFALSHREMVWLEGRPLRYAQSAFFVRYLLEGAEESGRQGFLAFLRQAAKGGGVEPEDLVAELDRDWQQLENDFHRWLVVRSRKMKSRH